MWRTRRAVSGRSRLLHRALLRVLLEHFLSDRCRRDRYRPASVERQMRDHLNEFVFRQAVFLPKLQMKGQLLGAIERDQRGDCDQTPVALGKIGALPNIAEQHLLRKLEKLGCDVAEHRRRCRSRWLRVHSIFSFTKPEDSMTARVP